MSIWAKMAKKVTKKYGKVTEKEKIARGLFNDFQYLQAIAHELPSFCPQNGQFFAIKNKGLCPIAQIAHTFLYLMCVRVRARLFLSSTSNRFNRKQWVMWAMAFKSRGYSTNSWAIRGQFVGNGL